jgi:hypothetical protein
MINLTYDEAVQLSGILAGLAQTIDLTEAQYKLATQKYNTVAELLTSAASLLRQYKPQIRVQGSIRLGIAARPLYEDSEFDVDLTCLLQAMLPNVQFNLKKITGDQLCQDERYRKMIEEKRRCWRLVYAESSRFHLDIVTAIPDQYQWLINLGVPHKYAEHAINITDKEHPGYKDLTIDFPKSNTEGYALWFLDIMKTDADRIRKNLQLKMKLASIEEVPEYKIRTPLQQSVLLMKRHRDIMFEGKDDCPISIIITTLTARAYDYVLKNNPPELFYEALIKIAEAMPRFIEVRSGVKWIVNPVNPRENFADKWARHKQKEKDFYDWHAAFVATLKSDRIKKGFTELGSHLKDNFGARAVNETLNNIGANTLLLRQSGQLRTSAAGTLGAAGTLIRNHTFDGNAEG